MPLLAMYKTTTIINVAPDFRSGMLQDTITVNQRLRFTSLYHSIALSISTRLSKLGGMSVLSTLLTVKRSLLNSARALTQV